MELRPGSFGESESVLTSIRRERSVKKGPISQNYPERSHFNKKIIIITIAMKEYWK